MNVDTSSGGGEGQMSPKDYLSRPYARRLVPDPSGGYVATIQEFPGLVAEGDSADEALQSLEVAAEDWIASCLETGRAIPEPVALGGYSGKIALRIPRGLHKRSVEMASSEGSSLNQWLTTAISHYLGGREATHRAVEMVFKNYQVSITTNNYIAAHVVRPDEGVETRQNIYGSFGAPALTIGSTGALPMAYYPYIANVLGDQDG